MEETTGFCTVIADRHTGRLLGARILGPDASTLIQLVVQAMSFGQDARDVARRQY
jgi:mycothione reductase